MEGLVFLEVRGMSCQGCVKSVSQAVIDTGLASVRSIDLATGIVQVFQENKSLDSFEFREKVLKAVQKKGYRVKVLEERDLETQTRQWSVSLFLSVVLSIPLLILEMKWVTFSSAHWISFLLATGIQFFGGIEFYRNAWSLLKERKFSVDSLVVLSSSTAYLVSLYLIVTQDPLPQHLYFLEAASIITLISLGHYLEHRVLSRADRTLRSLIALTPQKARRKNSNGTEDIANVSDLLLGDHILLAAGDRVPVDGIVIEGTSSVDESTLSGESLAVSKKKGDPLLAGSLNLSGALEMELTAIGRDSALQKIVLAMKRLQYSQANIQSKADRISNVFVPVVVFLSLMAFLLWGIFPEFFMGIQQQLAHALPFEGGMHEGWEGAFLIAIGVLVIACPCALGLATPAALMAGSNLAAKFGILIKDARALEKSKSITHVLFDKTGTLTTGKFVIEDRHNSSDCEEGFLNELVSSLAQSSKHPLSQALAGLGSASFALSDYLEVPGKGVMAKDKFQQGAVYRLGSLEWFKELGFFAKLPQEFLEKHRDFQASMIFVFEDSRFMAAFALKDSLKEGAQEVLEVLKTMGKEVLVLSGDRREVALDISSQLGLAPEKVLAELKPEEKLHVIESLEDQGASVAFVGDGINDALALQKADLGISLSHASHIAQQSADIILLNTDIKSVPRALNISERTLKVIVQNLFWAFFYNVVAIPLAFFGFLSPIICALAMGLSDLFVVVNSLRLLKSGSRDTLPDFS